MENSKLVSSYIVTSDHPVVDYWKDIFSSLATNPQNRLRIIVRPSDVTRKAPAMLQQLLMAVQHSPHIITQLIKGIQIDFAKNEEGKELYAFEEWKAPVFGKWFLHLAKLFPAAVYFLSDYAARHFSLAGDVFFDKGTWKGEEITQKNSFLQKDDLHEMISRRLFTASCFFGKFCYCCGQNPDKYIEEMIEEYQPEFTLQEVKDAYMYILRNPNAKEKAMSAGHPVEL